MKPKNFAFLIAASVLLATPAFAAPTITGVTARQRYPWNGKVDIAYTASGDIPATAKEQGLITSLKVTATDLVTGTSYTATSLSGDTGLSDGTHSLVWDMDAQGLTLKSTNVVFSVSCEATPATYCVIDLSAGTDASSYPVSYLAEPPDGGFNVDEYKTTKLVLKRIEAGTFIMGSDQTDESHRVTLTKPFYMGLFEMTQKQYSLVTGNNPSSSSGDTLPVERVSYNDIRGASNGAQWPASNAVDDESFLGKLRARTGLDFDLPTEAQWEYACRAGTTTRFSYGDSVNGEYMWWNGNMSSGGRRVGTKLPNPWGLYDMHGDIGEWCLDWYVSSLSGGVDPTGPSSGSNRAYRPGNYYSDYIYAYSYARSDGSPSSSSWQRGFRLSRPLTTNAQGGSLCSGANAPTIIDLSTGTRTAALFETIRYSATWETSAAGATAVVAVNGETLSSATGSGTTVWQPTRKGTYTLTHKVMNGGAQVGATLTATFAVQGPATPVISPEGGVSTGWPLSVSMTCATEGATIHYTTDGTEPTATSPVYQGLPISQCSTVKAVAVKDGVMGDVASVDVISVAADAKGKTFGDDDPALTVTVTGLVGTDTVAYTLARTEGEDIGTYTITPSGAATQGNYIVVYETANLTISPKTLAVVADAKSKVYGDADPVLTYTVSGLVGTDTLSGTLARAEGENVGTYAITQGTLDAGANYMIAYTGENLTISPKTLTVVADAKSKVYGDADPALTYTVSGLVGTDTLSGALSRAEGENVGTYAITQGTLDAGANYTIAFTGANLTITTPEAPVISPEGGVVAGWPQSITMTCATEGTTIHYTTDGTDPTADSPTYRRFRISERTTVKAVAVKDGVMSEITVAEYALGRCDDPVIDPVDGTSFEHSGQTVSIDWQGEDGVLRYTTDGCDPTAESPIYEGAFTVDNSTVVKAQAFGDQFFDSAVVTANLTRVWVNVATPTITAASSFTGSNTKVTLSCATAGATIRYTLNGNDPNSHSTRYTKPFYVTDSCTVKAYAVCGDYLASEIATFSIEKVWGIGDTLGAPDHAFTTGGNLPFVRVVDATAPLGESMRSGAITHEQVSTLSTTVMGPGTISFQWKTSCEDSGGEYDWDHAEFEVDGAVVAKMDGETAWLTVSHAISGAGPHTLVWRYVKDDVESEGEDCCWVADYLWTSDYTATQTTEAPVPYVWLRSCFPAIADEYEAYETAAKAVAANDVNKVWECYVAGLDPTDPAARFLAEMSFDESGRPSVSWKPDLGNDRNYVVEGKASLADEWGSVNEGSRFFRVKVSLPQAP